MSSQVLDIRDSDRRRVPAEFLLGDRSSWGAQDTIARLAKQLVDRNRGLLRDFGVEADVTYYGSDVCLDFRTSTTVGAFPLRSPTTARVDYGLVIRPRFEWLGIGEMLSVTGWQVVPDLLAITKLPQSDRQVPPWVLSSVVLRRLDGLLDNLTREFRHKQRMRSRPTGRVDWERYARRSVARGKLLEVPASRPELVQNRALRSAIRYTLQEQLRSLETQRSAGAVVVRLIETCRELLERVSDVQARAPRDAMVDGWGGGPLTSDVFEKGLEAIDWTVDERGLAGLGDVAGLPWRMSMAAFFESWVESTVRRLATSRGGTVRVARDAETTTPIRWDPPFLGSQTSLKPDVILERPDHTIVFDAKYKSHWEEIDERSWRAVRDDLRERHRHDLLQVLAYANLPRTDRVTACLVYPCHPDTWRDLRQRDRITHTAEVTSRRQHLQLVLAAIPMAGDASEVATELADALATG